VILKQFVAILCVAFQILTMRAQEHRVLPSQRDHAREHLSAAGYSGEVLDSMLALAQQRKLDQINSKPEYHPFGDERDTRMSMPGFDCENDNWGFEEGNLSGWTTTGTVSVVDSGTDPYGNYSWVYPEGGNRSVKISGDQGYADYGSLTRNITVPNSGVIYFTFHFAMSIFNYPHISYDASKFKVRLYGSDGAELECPSYTCFYSTDLGPQGVSSFQQTAGVASDYNPFANGDCPQCSNVTYSDWTTVTLDLSGYHGETLSIEFRVDWCGPGPDWSYALVDVDCPIDSDEPQLRCSSALSYSACAPDGMASYVWTNDLDEVIGTSQCIEVMQAGNYSCEFLPQDVQCTAGSAVNIDYILAPYPNAITSVDPNGCIAESLSFTNNSTIDAGIIDGYMWDFGDGTQNTGASPTHAYIASGQYDVSMIVYSDFGCRDTSNHVISIIPSPIVDFQWTTDCLLPEADMTDLSQASGSPIMSRSWDALADGVVESSASNPTLSFVSPGTFPVRLSVTDGNNCTGQKTKQVLIYDLVELNSTSQSDFNGYNINCFGSSSGSVSIDAGGGDASYTYLDENGSVIATDLSGLSAGNYPLIVQDGRGCRDTLEVEITQPAALTVSAAVISDYNGFSVSCAGSADGQSLAIVNGGVGPFQYDWTTGVAGETSNVDLPIGSNYVIVTDANGCEQMYQFSLSAPTALDIAIESQSDYNGYSVSCFGSEDGWVNLSGSGGVGEYFFVDATDTAAGLYEGFVSGAQTFTMTDANGCVATLDVNFTEPASIECNTSVLSDYNGYNVSCFGFNDAVAGSQPSGGVAPFAHAWSNGGTQVMNDSLAATDTWVMLTDDNNCQRRCDFVIVQPEPLEAIVNNLPDTCARSVGSFVTTLEGGVAPYTCYWFNHTDSTYTSGYSYAGAEAGVYDFYMTDLNGCQRDYTFEKSEIPPADVSIVRPSSKLCTQDHTKFEVEADKSIISHSWNFNDQYYSTQSAPEIFFEEPGEIRIDVSVLDEHNCLVDTNLTVVFEEGLTMFIPNAITADGDGVNDVFGAVCTGELSYHCVIFDRWGTIVFESTDSDQKWLGGSLGGTHYNGIDVFNYLIEVVGECEVEKKYRGHVTLVR
jgi:hypothetical protein